MKKVLIATHEYSGIYKNFKKDLENNGYKVFCLIFTHYKRPFKNCFDRLRYQLFKGKNIKLSNNEILIYNKRQESKILKFFDNFEDNQFDYSLFIRADFFSINIIKKVTQKSNYNISYHWDGVDRFKGTIDRIPLFDKFYVYEENDYLKYNPQFKNIELTNSFYFTSEIENQKENLNSDILFLGASKKSRMRDIVSGYNFLKSIDPNLNIKMLLYYEDNSLKKKYSNYNFTFFNKPKDYSETVAYTKQTKIILDFLIKEDFEHSGLSLRFFEAMHYEKKIISDNIQIKKYDFYDSQNIFILGKDDKTKLVNFINTPYKKISEAITEKYSFIKWFHNKVY